VPRENDSSPTYFPPILMKWVFLYSVRTKPSEYVSLSRETKWQVKWHAKGMRIGKKIPRKYVTDGKENFLACQFTLHLAAHYFYFLEFTCQMAISCFTGFLDPEKFSILVIHLFEAFWKFLVMNLQTLKLNIKSRSGSKNLKFWIRDAFSKNFQEKI
jgi:hypothetical protein